MTFCLITSGYGPFLNFIQLTYENRRYKLAHLFGKEEDQIGYLYDFGDRWYHTIEVCGFILCAVFLVIIF